MIIDAEKAMEICLNNLRTDIEEVQKRFSHDDRLNIYIRLAAVALANAAMAEKFKSAARDGPALNLFDAAEIVLERVRDAMHIAAADFNDGGDTIHELAPN